MRGIETKEDFLTLLGLKEGKNLAAIDSIEHPLGVIRVTRNKTGFDFRLTEKRAESGESLQSGEVRWATSVENR
jgi:hypothetical protein